ncbi:MAG: hypothetical protein ACI9RU_001903 [Litorivivens sp.]
MYFHFKPEGGGDFIFPVEGGEDGRVYIIRADKIRIRAILKGAKKYVGLRDVGSIGWCFDGGWSLQASIEFSIKIRDALCIMGCRKKTLSY